MTNITTSTRPAQAELPTEGNPLTWQEAYDLGLDACPPGHEEDEELA